MYLPTVKSDQFNCFILYCFMSVPKKVFVYHIYECMVSNWLNGLVCMTVSLLYDCSMYTIPYRVMYSMYIVQSRMFDLYSYDWLDYCGVLEFLDWCSWQHGSLLMTTWIGLHDYMDWCSWLPGLVHEYMDWCSWLPGWVHENMDWCSRLSGLAHVYMDWCSWLSGLAHDYMDRCSWLPGLAHDYMDWWAWLNGLVLMDDCMTCCARLYRLVC